MFYAATPWMEFEFPPQQQNKKHKTQPQQKSKSQTTMPVQSIPQHYDNILQHEKPNIEFILNSKEKIGLFVIFIVASVSFAIYALWIKRFNEKKSK